MEPRIIYEDKQIIVCRKPAGIPVQSSRVSTPDMVSILKNHLVQERASKSRKPSCTGKPPYLAVIHRLDQPVEGLLVFAKTPAAARELNRQLTSSGFGKYYLAVVRGIPSPSSGFGKYYLAVVRGIPSPSEADLMDYLVKDGRSNTSRVCTAETPGARPARLHYRLAETYGEGSGTSSLLEIQLDTGRHHQIRVQMANLGCPLVGDRKYGERENSGPLMLCACRLVFRHPGDQREMSFELTLSDLPWHLGPAQDS